MEHRFWDRYPSWDVAEAAWDAQAARAADTSRLRTQAMPSSPPAIGPGEGSMRWNGLRWVLRNGGGRRLLRLWLRHPVRYSWRFFCSMMKKKPYCQEGDFFFYGVKSEAELCERLAADDALLIVGCSYCQKPFECPCGRFSDGCTAALDNPVCQQCTIGKVRHALPKGRTIPLVIPTINDIGTHVSAIIDAHPSSKIFFIIAACQMALEMFGDLGNMVGIEGVGIRLGGRVCNTMRAFALSEEGIKPGLTVIDPSTQRRLLDVVRFWRARTRGEEAAGAEQGEGGDHDVGAYVSVQREGGVLRQ